MAEEISFNKKMATVKLLLSSLFARKQNFLVVNGRQQNKLIFTSIPSDRVVFYKPDIDDTLSIVQLTDKSASVVYELFPIFKDTIAVINLPKFLSMMNKKLAKEKGKAPVPDVNQETGEITFSVPEGMNIDDLFTTDKEKAQYVRGNGCLVGHLITEDVYESYERILNTFTSFVREPIEKEITIPAAYANDKVILSQVELSNNRFNKDVCFNLPIKDGITLVSFKEYLTKQKKPWTYRVSIQYNDAKSVAKVSYAYRDDLVDVVSIAPGSLWFPFSKR